MPTPENPPPIDVPMPIRSPRLLIRPKQHGDGAPAVAAISETWNELHQWMDWAENLSDFTADQQELRISDQIANFLSRQELNLLGLEVATGQPVIWCSFYDIDWQARECYTGFWVRKSAQRRGFATEATNALLRYAFAALSMRRVHITHSQGNIASRRIVQKLGFTPECVLPDGNLLPGGRVADKHCYSRSNPAGLPPLHVQWGEA